MGNDEYLTKNGVQMKFFKRVYERLITKKSADHDYSRNNQIDECKKYNLYDGGRPVNLEFNSLKGEDFDVNAEMEEGDSGQEKKELQKQEKLGKNQKKDEEVENEK